MELQGLRKLIGHVPPLAQEFIPHMAKQYGFQYELVQYKWPRWLHQQTEKQRIIWGYKILFLDVLFPLAVDKILFVDADQVCVCLCVCGVSCTRVFKMHG